MTTDRIEQAAPDVREVLEARIAQLEKALEPFASHIGKVDAPVTLTIGKSTWTGTLTGQDFANASHVLNLRRESYRQWLRAKVPGYE